MPPQYTTSLWGEEIHAMMRSKRKERKIEVPYSIVLPELECISEFLNSSLGLGVDQISDRYQLF
jgi:hypothetical protein